MADVFELNLTQIVNTDRDGNEIKDFKGLKTYLRDDASALYQLMETCNSKDLTNRERALIVDLSEKSRTAFLTYAKKIELNKEEALLLKKILENDSNKDIVYPMFFMRTMVGLLGQLDSFK